jgi:hypothetical protein
VTRTRTRCPPAPQANLFLLLSLIGAGLYGEAKRRDAPPPTPPAAAYDEEAPDSDSVPLIALSAVGLGVSGGSAIADRDADKS